MGLIGDDQRNTPREDGIVKATTKATKVHEGEY
jgi:hypothetical protein